ncbi:MAG: hypothetical protein J5606_00030 [Bacteroidales bacterium]|nr:hypothetical protein [Bacteroidales bacterium]
MEKLIRKIGNIYVIAIAVIAIVFAFLAVFNINGAGSVAELQAAGNTTALTALNVMYSLLVYALIGVSLLLIIAFLIMQVASNKKQAISTLILLGICAVVVLVAYLLAPKEITEMDEVALRVGISNGLFVWVSTLMNIIWIVFIGVIAAIIGSLVYVKIIK